MVNDSRRHAEHTYSNQSHKKIWPIGLFLLIFTVIAFWQIPSGSDFAIGISFFVNAIGFSIGLLTAVNKHSYSLNLIFWIFMYFFMFFAPLMQYAYRSFPLNTVEQPSREEILTANFTILVFCILWSVGKAIFYNCYPKNLQRSKLTAYLVNEYEQAYNAGFILIFLICVLLTLYFLFRNGFLGIVVSRDESGGRKFYDGDIQAISSIVFSLTVGVLTFAIMAYASVAKKNRNHYFAVFLLLVMLLICYFPTTIPRFTVATIYFGILIVLFRRLQRGTLFFWMFILGLFIIFPFLNNFRYSTDVSLSEFLDKFFDGFFHSYTEGHYDAYQSLINTFRFVRQNGITFGRQLLGSILFFVPRSIWNNKPIGSGAYMIENLAPGTFSNISCTLVGECYINFGVVGVVLVPLMLGYYFTKLDYLYHENKAGNGAGFAPYVFCILLFFFVLRGDLMSSFSYSFGFLFSGYIVKILLKSRNTRQSSDNNMGECNSK